MTVSIQLNPKELLLIHLAVKEGFRFPSRRVPGPVGRVARSRCQGSGRKTEARHDLQHDALGLANWAIGREHAAIGASIELHAGQGSSMLCEECLHFTECH